MATLGRCQEDGARHEDQDKLPRAGRRRPVEEQCDERYRHDEHRVSIAY